MQAEDALYGKRYEVSGGPGEQQQYSQPGQEMLEGIKVEERLVNSILNDTHSILADMFQQDGGDPGLGVFALDGVPLDQVVAQLFHQDRLEPALVGNTTASRWCISC